MAPRVALALTLLALLWAGTRILDPPAPRPRSAPTDVFSAERALDPLGMLAQRSRAVGTPGHREAREYLARRAGELGAEVEVQTAAAHVRFPGAPGFSAGTMHNVVARLPGHSSTGTVVVNAHYDSGTTGPGANDCGTCVATALEAMRALADGPPLRNDVVFVFSDAEEEGDLGAAAFAGQHRWMADVRAVVNYEAQGTGGASFLYAVTPESGWLVERLVDEAPDVAAFSWMGAVMELYPAGQLECDLAEYAKEGAQGLGFVYAGGEPFYHTRLDDVEHVDPGTVQQQGDYTVHLVRSLGEADLGAPRPSEDRVFFSVLRGRVVHYPRAWIVPLAALLTVAVLGLLVLGRRRGRIGVGRVVTATLWLAVALVATVVATVVVWAGVRAVDPDLRVNLVGRYGADLYLAGLTAIQMALMSGAVVAGRRRWSSAELGAAAVVAWLPILWLMSGAMPAMSYIVTWPLATAVAALVWIATTEGERDGSWTHVAVLALAASGALVLLPATVHQAAALLNRFEGAAGIPAYGAVSLFIAPVLLLLVPQTTFVLGLQRRGRWRVPGTLALAAAGLLVVGSWGSPFDSSRPRPDHMSYVLYQDRGEAPEARWVSFDVDLDAWTGRFIDGPAARGTYQTVAWGTMPAYTAPAPVVELPGPTAEVVAPTSEAGVRSVRIRIASPRGASHLRGAVETQGPIHAAAVDGRPLDLADYAWARDGRLVFNYAGLPAEGMLLDLTVPVGDSIHLTVEDSTLGFPLELSPDLPPRPDDTMPSPLFRREATEIRTRHVF